MGRVERLGEVETWLISAATSEVGPDNASSYQHLKEGNLERAIKDLELSDSVARKEVTPALTALYLERAQRRGSASDAVRALDVVNRDAGGSAAAEFNHGLALAYFGMRTPAAAAFRRAARMTTSEGWREEARARALALEGPLLEAQWSAFLRTVQSANDEQQQALLNWAAHSAKGHLFDFALYGVLGNSGCTAHSIESAACIRQLLLVERIGIALGEQGKTLVASVRNLRSASASDRAHLLRGYIDLRVGHALIDQLDAGEARPILRRAFDELRSARSPTTEWAQYWLASTYLHSGQYGSLRDMLRLLLPSRDPRVEASVARTLGTAALRAQDLSEARLQYTRSIATFRAVNDQISASVVTAYLADVAMSEGKSDEEWRLRAEGLRTLADWPSGSDWPYLMLLAARWAERAQLSMAAEEMIQGYLQAPKATNGLAPAAELAEAFTLLGEVQGHLERTVDSAGSLQRAESYVALVPDQSLRAKLAADVALVRGEAPSVCNSGASRVIRSLTSAIRTYENLKQGIHTAQALELRARCFMTEGNDQAAETDLGRGIEARNNALAAYRGSYDAVHYAEVGQRLYDALVELRLRNLDRWSAFALGDRAKDSFFERSLPTLSKLTVTRDQLKRSLRPGEALVSITFNSDKALVLAATMEGLAFEELQLPELLATQHAREFLRLLAGQGRQDEIQAESAWLYAKVLAPVRHLLPGTGCLYIVPDRSLNFVPFAALYDAPRGRYLIEDRPIAILPSVARLLALRTMRPASRQAWLVGLVGAGTAPERSERAEALPGATAELEEIASLYHQRQLITGPGMRKKDFFDLAARANVLHYAGHAHGEPGQPELSRLQLGADGEDVTATEVATCQLSELALVFLAGCETGLPSSRRVLGGDGIAMAFLVAGARAVVATLWAVDDSVASALAAGFHHDFTRGSDAADALRSVQIGALHSSDRTLASPRSWAAYQLTGIPVTMDDKGEGENAIRR